MNSAVGVQTTAAPAAAHPSASHALVLQTLAHELRQPLSNIESIAYYLDLVLSRDDHRSREQASRLQHLVEQSNWILSCGLQLVDEAPIAPAALDLRQLISQTAAARPSQSDPCFELEFADGLPFVQLDPGRGRALIENLLTLFEHLSDRTLPIRLATALTETGVCLSLTVAAVGYRSEASFGPGCCLSLASARRVVEAHRGTLDLEVNPTTGIVLKVVLP